MHKRDPVLDRLPLQSRSENALWPWVAGALVLHGWGLGAARLITSLDLSKLAPEAVIDVHFVRDEPKPKPPPPPEPKREEPPPPLAAPPPPKLKAPLPKPKEAEPPPIVEQVADLVAKAAKVLTTDRTDADAPAIASGNADKLMHGFVAGDGKGDQATMDARARLDGRAGGRGVAPAPTQEFDRSRPAKVIPIYTDECPFPGEADAANVNRAVVTLVATVGPNGKAMGIAVVTDPGYGFGREARRCAFKLQYRPALDRAGTPIEAYTAPFSIRFTR